MTPLAALRPVVLLALAAGVARGQFSPVPRQAPNTVAQPTAQHEGTPALHPERVAGEVVAGTYAGVFGYFIGRGIGTIATTMMRSDNDRLREFIVNDVGIASAAFAIGGTVYAIGTMGAETGDFPTTMVGVSAGVAASLIMSRLVFKGRMPVDESSSRRKWLMATLDSSLPAIGATIAFNASRKWQR